MRLVQAGTMLLGAVMYGFVIAFSGELSSAGNLYWNFFIIGFWNTLLIVVTALAVVDGLRKIRAGETRALGTGVFVVKLAAIPFFLLNFYVLALLAFTGMLILIFGGAALLVVVGIGIGLTYLAMLSTNVYAWAAIAQLRRERGINTGLAVLYTFLSLGFVTDIAAGILLFGHSRRRPGLALVSVLVSLGLIVVGLGLTLPDLITDRPHQQPDLPLIITGLVVVVATVVIALVRRSTLRRRHEKAPEEEIGS